MSGHLSVNRIKTIMKSSADVDNVSKESTYVLTRATELFLKLLAKEAYKNSKKSKKLDYKNVANVVHSSNRYDFLQEMIPHKITVQEYFKLMKEQTGQDMENEEDSSSEESSSEEENATGTQRNRKGSPDSDVIVLD